MKFFFGGLFVSGLFTSMAFSRIGETVAECVARYGQEDYGDEKSKNFKKNEISISFDFRNGVAVSSYYSGEGGFGNLLGKLSDDTIKEILKVNGEGKAWEEIKTGTDAIFQKDMKRADGKMFATWSYSTGSISFITAEEKSLRETEAKMAEEKEKKAAADGAKKAVDGL